LEQIQHIVFSPDGSGLAIAGGTVGESGTVDVFDWPSGKLRQRMECHSDVVNQVRFSEDGSHVVTAAHDGVCGWFGVGGSRAKTRISDHSGPVSAVVILPGGTTAVSGSVDQTLRVWDIRQGQTIRTLHNHVREVNDVALRPGGLPLPMVASAGADRTVRFWQPTIGRMVRFVRLDAEPLALAWICGGAKLVAACRDAQVRVIDPAAAKVIAVVPVAAAGSEPTGPVGPTAEAESWLYAAAVDPLDECRCAFGGSNGLLSIQRFGNPPR